MIKLASWNVTGFHVHKVEEFIDNLDFLGIVETWTHQDSPISLPGYKHFHQPAKKLKKKGRRSGGILVYYKDTFDNGVKLMSQYDYGIWLKLDKNFFGTEFDLYLAVIYIKPKTPTFDPEDTFLKLKLDIAKFSSSGKVILTGDFNSRTGKLPDFITNDSTFPKSTEDILPSDYSCDTCSERLSRDKIVNCQGKLLLETCIETKSRILNGRLLGDSAGNFTYFDPRGGCSLIDYCIVSEDILHCITYFNAMSPTEHSGHCMIRMGIVSRDCNHDYLSDVVCLDPFHGQTTGKKYTGHTS